MQVIWAVYWFFYGLGVGYQARRVIRVIQVIQVILGYLVSAWVVNKALWVIQVIWVVKLFRLFGLNSKVCWAVCGFLIIQLVYSGYLKGYKVNWVVKAIVGNAKACQAICWLIGLDGFLE